MKNTFTILSIIVFGLAFPQTTNDENIAREYYKQGEYLKASQLYENIFKKKKTKTIYAKYLECLIKTQAFNKAQKVIKSFYKKTNDPTALIDHGEIYLIQNNKNEAYKKFNQAINEGKKNRRHMPALGAKFFRSKHYEYALEVYEILKKQVNKPSYSIQISNIYSATGKISKMYETIIELLYEYPNYFQTCKNKLRITISDDGESENNQKLKKILIQSIQKKKSYEISKMLVWLFMQEKKFQKALEYEISIDKRISDNELEIINLGDIAFKNQKYITAKNAFQYILNTYSYGLSKNIWRNYSIQTPNEQFQKTKITFYKSNFSFPIIKINYSNKLDKEVFEVTHNSKKKIFSNIKSLNLWLKNYFF